MTQLTLELRPNVTVLAVLVDNDAEHFAILDEHIYVDHQADPIRLPPGNWEIIGLLREVSEDVAATLVENDITFLRPNPYNIREDEVVECWKDYRDKTESLVCFNAVNSLRSAFIAAGGDPEKNWLLLKQIQ